MRTVVLSVFCGVMVLFSSVVSAGTGQSGDVNVLANSQLSSPRLILAQSTADVQKACREGCAAMAAQQPPEKRAEYYAACVRSCTR